MSLKTRLAAEIAELGPMGVDDFMRRCLHDPREGYYATRPALGADGDFVTAPMVSQMFGELLGLWAAQVWAGLGRPGRVRLVEAGPGDGTLMADMLRAARVAPGFLDALEVVMVETSPPLAERQRARLAAATVPVGWVGDLAEIPPGAPVVLVANELLDCLPARQFVRTATGWAERCVGLSAEGELTFGLRAVGDLSPLLPLREKVSAKQTDEGSHDVSELCGAADSRKGRRDPSSGPSGHLLPQGEKEDTVGLVWETSPAQAAFATAVARLVLRDSGAALLIDYGRDRREPGDTLQALRRHAKVDPLACPGEADLTVWADFPSVIGAARTAGAAVTEVVAQGVLLERLGLGARAEALARARPDQVETIARQRARLADPDQMGALFKACAIYRPGDPVPPGFEETP